MTIAAPGHANASLSGRELALQRRQAMARQGKTAIAKASAPRSSASGVMDAGKVATAWRGAQAPASAGVTVAQASTRVESLPAEGVSPARARRQALATVGKAALKTVSTSSSRPSAHLRPATHSPAAGNCGCDAQCGCQTQRAGTSNQEQVAQRVAASEVSVAIVASQETAPRTPAAAGGEQATGRALAKMRRAALTQDGKAGLKRVAQATKIAAAMPGQDWQAAMMKGATGRQVAMQHRLVQSIAGRAGLSTGAASRPSGRVKARDLKLVMAPAPVKVEEGHTLSGQAVTGTMVERSTKVTGNEPGSCRSITGTEYIGTEQFQSICGVRAEPGASKVAISSTLREQKITGTALGRSPKATGDEPGACHTVTGTEYLSAARVRHHRRGKLRLRPPRREKLCLVPWSIGRAESLALSTAPIDRSPARAIAAHPKMTTCRTRSRSRTPARARPSRAPWWVVAIALPATKPAAAARSPEPNTCQPSFSGTCAAPARRQRRARSASCRRVMRKLSRARLSIARIRLLATKLVPAARSAGASITPRPISQPCVKRPGRKRSVRCTRSAGVLSLARRSLPAQNCPVTNPMGANPSPALTTLAPSSLPPFARQGRHRP